MSLGANGGAYGDEAPRLSAKGASRVERRRREDQGAKAPSGVLCGKYDREI